MIFLRSIKFSNPPADQEGFPYCLPAWRGLEELAMHAPVTFFVGENGSGKSTLLEALALGVNSISATGENLKADPTLEGPRQLAKSLRFIWTRRTHKGFFLRAEDFFRFARNMSDLGKDMEEAAAEYEQKLSGYGLQLARGAVLGQKRAIEEKYGEDLNAHSHGESFLNFFQARFVPGGLYLLDEPEAPLSPKRQLAFISMMKKMAEEEEAQFIISTHSPILMALPGASIYSFDGSPMKVVPFDETDHVVITKNFLNHPESFLRHL